MISNMLKDVQLCPRVLNYLKFKEYCSKGCTIKKYTFVYNSMKCELYRTDDDGSLFVYNLSVKNGYGLFLPMYSYTYTGSDNIVAEIYKTVDDIYN